MEEVQLNDTKTQEEIIDVIRKLQEAYNDGEEHWQQKSLNMWHTSVDVNTKFYHALRKKRRSVNRLVGLHDEGGQWITEEKGVEKIVVDYFDD